MLFEIRIENFILIEALNIRLTKGLNIFTGETGAGKSMIIGAINACLGGKVSPDLIRKGHEKAVVQLAFHIENPSISRAIESFGIEVHDGLLIVTREILSTNRSVIRLNDRVATIGTLKDIAKYLIDIHGQHEHQSLLYPKNHLTYLDAMGDADHQVAIQEVKNLYQEIKSLQGQIESLQEGGQVDVNYLKFQLSEIDVLNITEDDEKHLEDRYEYYKNHEQILKNSQGVLDVIAGDHERAGVKEMIDTCIRMIDEIVPYDKHLETYGQQLHETLYQLDDLQSEFRHYVENLDLDEEKMFEVEQRMNAISDLKLKYGKSISDILIKQQELSEQLNRAEHRDAILDDLNEKILQAKRDYVSKAKVLQTKRKALTKPFVHHVLRELSLLNMGNCRFEVGFVEKRLKDGEYRLSPHGFDDVEFLIATNPGVEVRPLAKIASGGEISRVMLAIKIALSQQDEIKTLIFDEVDTGISGQTALVVGEKIHEITADYQVLCITHLPQIAIMADEHFKIEKSIEEEFGITQVVSLSDEKRLSEIARMLSGHSESNTARQNALEMLEKANRFKNIS